MNDSAYRNLHPLVGEGVDPACDSDVDRSDELFGISSAPVEGLWVSGFGIP